MTESNQNETPTNPEPTVTSPAILDEPAKLEDLREAWIARYWDDFAMFDITQEMREEEGKTFDDLLNRHLALAWGKAANSIVQAFVNNPNQPLPENPYINGGYTTVSEHMGMEDWYEDEWSGKKQ